MDSIQFVGENLFWGNLGHTAVVVSFVTSIMKMLQIFQLRRKMSL
jgi:hypothetical protein